MYFKFYNPIFVSNIRQMESYRLKKNELRIGNLLHYPNYDNDGKDRVFRVRDIYTDDDKVGLTNGIIMLPSSRLKYLKPIPISGEMLIKLGFIKGKCKFGDNYVLIRNDYEIYFVIEQWVDTNSKWINHWHIKYTVKPFNIKYIHQLQNLFFAMTGEELVYKH